MMLSQKYSYEAKAQLAFINIPQDRVLNIDPYTEVDLKIEGSGWSLLFSKMRLNDKLLKVDLKNLGNDNKLLLSKHIDDFNKQLSSSQNIIDITPKQIKFDFSSRMVKKVPVRLRGKFSYQRQYYLSSDIHLFPDSVVVNGPIDEVRKINEWNTVQVNLTDLDDTVISSVNLAPSPDLSVRPLPDKVSMNIPVEKFTEGNIDLLLNMINNQENYEVNMLPSKIRVKFFCPLSRYPEVQPDMFDIVVDLNEWKKQNKGKLEVKILRSPDFIRIMNVYPTTIDFIVNK